ncbi:hypothetical protein K7I13_09135 [Brucepastera parasyntrophica]|uniref:hypothetical protein n=1 Tax=Brucepastera parasyntrophica TaxID=2880008 RepID=UPI00210BC045|nr:hypothetical protein [Brucepastera parasyntrophica]ULQ58717.1 hypothetical protein K7I13_09135 [Brucepastera parasyntrophica]
MDRNLLNTPGQNCPEKDESQIHDISGGKLLYSGREDLFTPFSEKNISGVLETANPADILSLSGGELPGQNTAILNKNGVFVIAENSVSDNIDPDFQALVNSVLH